MDAKEAEERLQRELTLLTSGSDAAWQRKLAEEREGFEDELRAQLRRAAAAHSEHLEEARLPPPFLLGQLERQRLTLQVLRVQQERAAEAKGRAVSEAVLAEREAVQAQIAASLATLQGIQAALESRAVQVPRLSIKGSALEWGYGVVRMRKIGGRRSCGWRARTWWRAWCTGARRAWTWTPAGSPSPTRSRPPSSADRRKTERWAQLAAIKEASRSDAFVNTVMRTLDKEALQKGVYTEEDLKGRFEKVT